MSSLGNFHFLAEHSPLLADLGATAERLFPFDPPSCVLKLRLLAEAITQDIAARLGVALAQPTQAELLRAVDARLGMDAQVRQLFHLLRRTGNQAAHEANRGITYREGLGALRVAREIAVWFYRSFGGTPIPLPSMLEQAEIIRRVETLFAFADRLEARLAQAQTVVDRLTPSLLAKAFRGELVPQDPADEPAAELLKRLQSTVAERPASARRGRRASAGACPT